jgi:hypothetical protein
MNKRNNPMIKNINTKKKFNKTLKNREESDKLEASIE